MKDYDYSHPGGYFVTVCTRNRECLLGEIAENSIHPSMCGEIVRSCWGHLPRHYPHVVLDAFVLMPNHVHGIIVLTDPDFVGAGLKPAPTLAGRRCSVPETVRAFKAFSSRRINEWRGTPGKSAWQRGYYEHIVRNEEDLNEIRKYITENPLSWELDRENPAALGIGMHIGCAPARSYDH